MQPDANGRLALLVSSPRVAPGLLSRGAWQVLAEADLVLCADPDDAQPGALAEAGIAVRASESGCAPATLARELVSAATEGLVVWVGSPDGDAGLTDALAQELSRVATHGAPPAVEVLVASHDLPGARLLDLVALMDRLRSPGGCPWDGEQTHESLVTYLVEEAFEAAEALETGDRAAIREELGDVLLQVVFHARVAGEHASDPFDVDDVVDGLIAKMVRRHPHVFAVGASDEGGDFGSLGALAVSWERLKADEKQREHVLDGVPVALPALERADNVLARLERAGIEAAPGDPQTVGGALLDVVRRAREQGVDPEAALREQVRRLESAARRATTGHTAT